MINTNAATFPLTTDGIKVKVYLHSDDGSTTPSIGNLVINYNDALYNITNPTIYPVTTLFADGLTSFTTTEVVVGSDEVRYTISKGGIEYYWDGLAWSVSSGYAQSNTAIEINANAASLSLTGGWAIRPVVYLHSNNGTTTPQIDLITLNYDLHGPVVGVPAECVVYGYLYDGMGDPMQGVTVKAVLNQEATYNSELIMPKAAAYVMTDVDGYWEISLVENANMTALTAYVFTFENTEIWYTATRVVPNTVSANFTTLASL